MGNYILSIDQGTTSSRVIVYNEKLEKIASGQEEFQQYFPEPGQVEHSLEEIWASVEIGLKTALDKAKVVDKGFAPEKIACIGITNQRETFGLWDRKTSQSVCRAIVWQDRRTKEYCEKLKQNKDAKKIARDSGLLLDPYFSGTKLGQLLKKNKELRAKAQKGALCFGTTDTYVLWKLTDGTSFATDVTNASRTLLMDIKKKQWSDKALKFFSVPRKILPEIKGSDAFFGKTKGLKTLPDGIPIHGILGDQQAALFGQACFKKGQSKITYGTGAFMLVNTGETLLRKKGALTTIAWSLKGKTYYALESSVFIAGAAVQWLRDGLKIIEKSTDVVKLSEQVEDSAGVFFIPAFTGLGSPYWVPEARALIGGLTRGSTDAHIAKACLEGIAHSIGDVFELMMEASPQRKEAIRVDGGASMNDYLMQFQSNLLQREIQRPTDVESTAKGAACIAAIGAGIYKKVSDVESLFKRDAVWKPQLKKKEAVQLKNLWTRRVRALIKGAY